MIKEDTYELNTILDLKREITKLKLEIKRKDKMIERLKYKIKKLEKR